MKDYLKNLRAKYRSFNESPDPMGNLLQRYRQYQNTRLLDLAAVACGLGIQPANSSGIDPLALKALHDTNPNFDASHVGSYSDEQWRGIVNAAKGKYFEYLVVDDLNHGGTVGDLTLSHGYSAHLADSMTQPAWDIRIIDEHGATAELLQLKATESAGYIHETLIRYPDISILTTHEVAAGLGPDEMAIDSKMTEADLDHAIQATAHGLDHGYLDQFWDHFHPSFGLLLITATQGYQVVMKKQTIAGAVEVAKARAARSLMASGVGTALKVVTHSWIVSALSAVTVGMLFDRAQNIDQLVGALRSRNKLLTARAQHYRALVARA